MGRQIVSTSKAAKPPATYSQAVKAAGLVFVSGTPPADPATGGLVGATIQEQTRQCLTNIAAIRFPSNPPARQGAKLPVRVPGLKVSIAAIAEA
jgi:2-iminobutanoate/2-iminopropanoate deaminase